MVWYSKPIDEVLSDLSTDASAGLSGDSVARRIERYGINSLGGELTHPEFRPWLRGTLPTVVICVIAAVFYAVTECYTHCAVVMAAAALTVLLKLYGYRHADRTLRAAETASRTAVTVIRGGAKSMVDQSELVPGDIVALSPGDIIAADVRLIESNSLFINESHLEGGFINSPKSAAADPGGMNEDFLSTHANMCYRGSSVVSGSGRGVVVATGAACAAAPSLLDDSRKPEYDSKILSRQYKRFTVAVTVFSLAVFLIGLLSRSFSTTNLAHMFYTCSGLLAASIPLGFTLCEILLLSVGMDKLSLRGISPKSFRALRDMSRTDILVVQKTGVVTSNEMTVTRMWTGGDYIDVRGHGWSPEGRFTDSQGGEINISRNRSASLTLIGGALCGNSDIEEVSRGKWTYRGDPTESALAALAAKAGLFRADVNEMFPRIAEYPFDSVRRRMATVHKRGRQIIIYVKGAPDAVLDVCTCIDVNGTTHELTPSAYDQLHDICSDMSEKGLRTIAVAYREAESYESGADVDDVERDLILCGIIGIENRVAPSSVSAYNLCSTAGIRTFMVTGDDILTATDTALSIGIHEPVLDAREFDSMSDDELAAALSQARVAARADSAAKQRIVNILRRTGSFVTYAGSSSSDAEALRAADIGIASGSLSTEVSRDSAQIVMEDGTFAAITRIIEESRRIFVSLKAYTGYAMTCSFALLLTMLVYAFSSGAMPFTALQLFWTAVILLTIPVFTIGRDANVHSVMYSKPRSEGDAVVNLNTVVSAFVQAIVPAALTVAATAIASSRVSDAAVICSTAFVTMTATLIFMAQPNRSSKTSLARIGMFTNLPLLLVTALSVVLLVLATSVPSFHSYFDSTSIGFSGWLFALLFAFISFIWGEVFKLFIRPVINKLIKDTPVNTGHRKFIDSKISGRFFEKFEGADPTQEESAYDPLFRRNKNVEEEPEDDEPDGGEAGGYSEDGSEAQSTDGEFAEELVPDEVSEAPDAISGEEARGYYTVEDTQPIENIPQPNEPAVISDTQPIGPVPEITEVLKDAADVESEAVEENVEEVSEVVEELPYTETVESMENPENPSEDAE